jgi:hypothetical protein
MTNDDGGMSMKSLPLEGRKATEAPNREFSSTRQTVLLNEEMSAASRREHAEPLPEETHRSMEEKSLQEDQWTSID